MSASDKIKGMANEVVGKTKQLVGKLMGSDKTKIEGKVQEVGGEVQVAVGKIKDTAKKGADSADAAIKKL